MTLLRVLLAWFVLALASSALGWLESVNSGILLVAGLVLPGMGFFILHARSRAFRERVLRLNLRHLTLLEAFRLFGGSYILVRDDLPRAFALTAGISDIAVALSALTVAFVCVSDSGRPKRGLWTWHLLGLLGIVASVTSGTLTAPPPVGILATSPTSQAFSSFPLSLIPAFLGPMVILIHLVVLATARKRALLTTG